MEHWNKLLKSLGFTESETKIYLVSLELGPSTVQDLAKKVDLSRMTVYTVIQALSDKGLMSSIQKGKKTLYNAESPTRLVAFVQSRVTKMEDTLREVEKNIRELSLMQRSDKPVVKMFEGEEALKAIQSDLTSTKSDIIYEFGNYDNLLRLYSLENDLENTHKDLEKSAVKRRAIYLTAGNGGKHGDSNIEKIILSPKDYEFDGDLLVYGKKIAISTLKGKHISVLIENEEMAQTLKSLLSILWKKIK